MCSGGKIGESVGVSVVGVGVSVVGVGVSMVGE